MKSITEFIARLKAYKFLIAYPGSYLSQTGWLRSLQSGLPMKSDGSPLPWMNYSLLAFLHERLLKNMIVFEYGSGNSTLFFADHVQSVTSVEADKKWYDELLHKIPENVNLIFQAADVDGQYCRTIDKDETQYDMVIVDGEDRINCLQMGLAKLNTTGVLILDDSNRSEYRNGIALVTQSGYKSLNFEGLKPNAFETEKATIFYKVQNCLNI